MITFKDERLTAKDVDIYCLDINDIKNQGYNWEPLKAIFWTKKVCNFWPISNKVISKNSNDGWVLFYVKCNYIPVVSNTPRQTNQRFFWAKYKYLTIKPDLDSDWKVRDKMDDFCTFEFDSSKTFKLNNWETKPYNYSFYVYNKYKSEFTSQPKREQWTKLDGFMVYDDVKKWYAFFELMPNNELVKRWNMLLTEKINTFTHIFKEWDNLFFNITDLSIWKSKKDPQRDTIYLNNKILIFDFIKDQKVEIQDWGFFAFNQRMEEGKRNGSWLYIEKIKGLDIGDFDMYYLNNEKRTQQPDSSYVNAVYRYRLNTTGSSFAGVEWRWYVKNNVDWLYKDNEQRSQKDFINVVRIEPLLFQHERFTTLDYIWNKVLIADDVIYDLYRDEIVFSPNENLKYTTQYSPHSFDEFSVIGDFTIKNFSFNKVWSNHWFLSTSNNQLFNFRTWILYTDFQVYCVWMDKRREDYSNLNKENLINNKSKLLIHSFIVKEQIPKRISISNKYINSKSGNFHLIFEVKNWEWIKEYSENSWLDLSNMKLKKGDEVRVYVKVEKETNFYFDKSFYKLIILY